MTAPKYYFYFIYLVILHFLRETNVTRFLLFFYENNESSSEHAKMRRQKVMNYCMDELLNCQRHYSKPKSEKSAI